MKKLLLSAAAVLGTATVAVAECGYVYAYVWYCDAYGYCSYVYRYVWQCW